MPHGRMVIITELLKPRLDFLEGQMTNPFFFKDETLFNNWGFSVIHSGESLS